MSDDDALQPNMIPGEGNLIAPVELRELRRVYDQFCNLSDKLKITEKLHPTQKRVALLKSPEMADEDEVKLNMEINELECDIEKWEHELDVIKRRPVQVIRASDVAAACKKLGKKTSKKEVLEMMWEVDENLDEVIDWDEFCLNFQRNVHDKTGLEPANFYNLVQFMIYDANSNGFVSIDETMNMLYARYGRDLMEEKISYLFGSSKGQKITEEGKEGGEIDFSTYIEAVEKTQLKMFHESELGRTILAKGKRKVDPNLAKTRSKKGH
ncbi:hypothetical protein TrLO_g7908 [Triparma laevis f. longispina]|uniref:EF-hand domain-containing protein n=2 Tax=Triparma laevis TaxID=1534972 RepID=A0A9W7L0X3_9STRA|nr:hypothetical protein TrLO_g7908 [Triparma laevis f. longispina]